MLRKLTLLLIILLMAAAAFSTAMSGTLPVDEAHREARSENPVAVD